MQRLLEKYIIEDLKDYPVVAILGVRQCGKTTLAKSLLSEFENSIYLDLEKPSDRNKLDDPEAFFNFYKNRLICLDEIQRMPEIFQVIRSKVDENNNNGQFLILGSASRDLIKQSSETLAGRISYLELTPLFIKELNKTEQEKLIKIWLCGGMPKSFLTENDDKSYRWRRNYIRTFIERDIPQLGFAANIMQIQRFWIMAAHLNGSILNMQQLGNSLGVSSNTIKSYMHILEQTFVLRLLRPYVTSIKKRLVKSPKLYIRDTGILHALLNIEDYDSLLGHPIYGSSWEGFVIENIITTYHKFNSYYYRTSHGAEIDLILERGNKKIAIECKASMSPTASKGLYQSMEDLSIDKGYIIAPVKDSYPLKNNIMVLSLKEFLELGL